MNGILDTTFIILLYYVLQIIKKCADEGVRPKVADFGNLVEESSFLNGLQSGVARWTREIQKVCALVNSWG